MFPELFLYEESSKKRTRLMAGDLVLFQYQPSTRHLLVKFERPNKHETLAFGQGEKIEWFNDKFLVGRLASDELWVANFIAVITGLKIVFVKEIPSFRIYELVKL